MHEPHLAFVVNNAAFFVSHRLPLAVEARRRGWNVTLLTGSSGSEAMEAAAVATLRQERIPHFRAPFDSASVNPFREGWALMVLTWKLLRIRPDIVHCASPKGMLYGGIAARVARVPALVLAISGMGYAFTPAPDGKLSRRLTGNILLRLARVAFRHRNLKVIVQNSDDERWLTAAKLSSTEDVCLIPGSGVDLEAFDRPIAPQRVPMVVLPSRLLRDKGVVEFVEAVRRIKGKVPDWRFVLAGIAGYKNPSAIARDEVERWVSEGLVEWPGYVSDMATLLMQASIVCLPSYREGLPKALLEAAAAGCAVITTDTVGCREAVVAGLTGDLVPVGDVEKLAEALLALINDVPRREAYGRSGRLLAQQKYSLESVVAAVFDQYAALQRRCRSVT